MLLTSPLSSPLKNPVRDVFSPAGSSQSLTAQVQALFASRVGGMWDMGDTSKLFQDSATLTTPVTTAGQTIGLVLDSKSTTVDATVITNGNFSVGTGWTMPAGVSISSGALRCTAASGYVYQNATSMTSGDVYKVTYTVSNYSGGSIKAYVNASPVFGFTVSANGVSTGYIRAGSASVEVGFNLIGFTGDIDDFSVCRIPGNHATQPTAGSRPLFSARKNLLTKTESFTDAIWTVNTVFSTFVQATAPDATSTAATFTGNGTNNVHLVGQVVYPGGNVISVKAKAGTARYLQILFDNVANSQVNFDLQLGTFSLGAGAASAAITAAEDGYYHCTAVSSGSPANAKFLLVTSLSASRLEANTISGSINLWHPQVETGSVATSYQRVNTASDYDTVGFPAFAQFDATDDALLFPAITFGGAFNTFVAGKVTSGTQGVHLWRTADVNGTWAKYKSGDVTTPTGTGSGSPAYAVNGTALSPSQQGQLYTQINGVDCVVESIGVVLTAETALQFSGFAGSLFTGNEHRILMISGTLTAAEKLLCRRWAAEGNGVTVV